MATLTSCLIQDQKLTVHYDGATVGGKTSVSKAQKKGGPAGRRALNDISNSEKPSTLQASKKHNVFSIGEDLAASKSTFSVKGKTNVSKAVEKVHIGGRKALSDLTNSGQPSGHQVSKKSQDKKLIAVAEEENLPSAISEERFLHNHQECIKAQRRTMDMDHFLMTVGLDNDISLQLSSPWPLSPSRKLKPEESPGKLLEMEEMLIEDLSPRCRKTELPGNNSPQHFGSSKSTKPYMCWEDYNFPNFMLIETPSDLPKH